MMVVGLMVVLVLVLVLMWITPQGEPGMSAYSASKHAAEAFTTAIRNELGWWGIKVGQDIIECTMEKKGCTYPIPDGPWEWLLTSLLHALLGQ